MLPLHLREPERRHRISVLFRLKWICETAKGWLWQNLSDQDSRNLLGFLFLNFGFAFVEICYGVWTNSLGLVADAFHMFFDCTGLIAGLVSFFLKKFKI